MPLRINPAVINELIDPASSAGPVPQITKTPAIAIKKPLKAVTIKTINAVLFMLLLGS